jgi:hypothetical protein
MLTGMTQAQLEEALGQVEAASLLGLELLRQLQPASPGWFPAETNPRALAEATVEFIEYTQACADLANRLACVGPTALTGTPIAEFPL